MFVNLFPYFVPKVYPPPVHICYLFCGAPTFLSEAKERCRAREIFPFPPEIGSSKGLNQGFKLSPDGGRNLSFCTKITKNFS